MDSRPFSIHLVVIARNEAKNIGRLLHSVTPWVDAAHVIDTGSTDDTAAVAAAAGASVSRFNWCDDFSAARNFALDRSAADWHLILDADEWLIGGGEFLLELRHTVPSCVGQVMLEDVSQDPHSGQGPTVSWLSRLLPGSVRYGGRVHEQPVHNLPVMRTPLRVGHDGYSPTALEAKRGRNRHLLQVALLEQPGNPYLMYQMAKDASVYEEHALADAWFRAAWAHRPPVSESWEIDLVVRWLDTLKVLQRHDEGVDLARQAHVRCSDSPDFHFSIGCLMLDWTALAPHRADELLASAESSWRRCLDIGEQPSQSGTVSGRGSHLAAFNLALILEGTGRAAEASHLRRQHGLRPANLLL